MSDCRDQETNPACFTPTDGSGAVPVVKVTVFDESGAAIATYYTDTEGEAIDPTSYLGGGEVVDQQCPEPQVDCVESQEWTYGLDNTGTSFADTATYLITLSDGTTLTFNQTPTASWTPQMQQWETNIQQAADDAGLVWFVETRFRDPNNPSNLAGGGGFPGPPSEVISEALPNMAWRYVNIQICPGQPTPARMEFVDSAQGRSGDLTTDGPVLGPTQRFFVCRNCGQEPVWYLDDGVTPAEAGQIPNCWEPCGTLVTAPAPPGRECEFFFDTACDNNNSNDPVDFTSVITRRITVCNGVITAQDFFAEDPTDPNALIEYTLVGDFVDCNTGEPVDGPPPECEKFEYVGKLWQLEGAPTPGTTVEWWAPTQGTFPGGANAAPHDNVSNIFVSNGSTLEHVNGAPDASFVDPLFSATTSGASFLAAVGAASNAETSGTDQLKLSGYLVLDEPALLRDTNSNTGERGGIALNVCCAGELEYAFERTTDTVSGDTGVFDGVRLPAGIHYVEAVTSDLSAWQGLQLSVSFDDGATFEPFTSYTSKPSYACVPVIKCADSGSLLNAETMDEITVGDFDTWCEPQGCDPCCGGGTGSDSGDAEYTTTFGSEFFSSAFSVPSAPADTKEVVVFNQSNAWMEFDTNYGTQIVPPNGTASWEVNGYEAGITFSSVTLLNGTFSGSDRWAINYRTAS